MAYVQKNGKFLPAAFADFQENSNFTGHPCFGTFPPQELLSYLVYMGTCHWSGQSMVFWPRYSDQGIQFYLALSETGSEPVLNRVSEVLQAERC